MADKQNTMDFGGLSLIVKDIKVADAPHQAGSETVLLPNTGVVPVGDQTEGTHVLPVSIGGVTYYILLSDDNTTA